MADDETLETGEAGETGEPGIEQRVDSLESKVDQILGIVRGGGGKPDSEPEPQRPGNIAEEIRAQLDERDRRDQAAADDKARGDRLAAVETKVAELAEKPPVTPPRRVEKLMGWR